jgi:hypothetical protein
VTYVSEEDDASPPELARHRRGDQATAGSPVGCSSSTFVGDVHARELVVRPARELLVLDRHRRSLADLRRAVVVECADPVAVGVAAALLRERVGRLEQPEGDGQRPLASTHREDATDIW